MTNYRHVSPDIMAAALKGDGEVNDIEQKALAMVNAIQDERGKDFHYKGLGRLGDAVGEALCRAIEQHEATKQELSDFKQEVSDTIQAMLAKDGAIIRNYLDQFIIPKPKPDPLVEMMEKLGWYNAPTDAKALRAALDALGFEIREKNDD